MKFRKKPVVIEAFQLGIDNMPDWFMDAVASNDVILHGTSACFFITRMIRMPTLKRSKAGIMRIMATM